MVTIIDPSFQIYEGENTDSKIEGMKILRNIENIFRITHQSNPKKIPDISIIKTKILELYNGNGRDYKIFKVA